ncbi:MAG: MOSC domain-containing protein [Alphaproteobacteria bacterium]|nr:MOSC domain-containing protein [Alphaproteobacteria bacterium]
MTPDCGVISDLYHYPIKGFSAQRVAQAQLKPNAGFPGDRQWGFAKPGDRIDPMIPSSTAKNRFYQLLQHERLAELRSEFDDETQQLTLWHRGQLLVSEVLTSAAAAQRVTTVIGKFLELPPDEQPQLAHAGLHQFTDSAASTLQLHGAWRKNSIALVGLSSVADLAARSGRAVDPLRFRSNLYFSGFPAFAELEWLGREITLGSARLKIFERTARCMATEVEPQTGIRDLPVVKLLKQFYDHTDMGVYGAVVEAGEIKAGDELRLH